MFRCSKKGFMAEISCGWNEGDKFYHISQGCRKGCSGCVYVSQMITVWAPEVPKEELWYGDFSNVTGDITVEIDPQLLEEGKAEPKLVLRIQRKRSEDEIDDAGKREKPKNGNKKANDYSNENVNGIGNDEDDSDSDKTIPPPKDYRWTL